MFWFSCLLSEVLFLTLLRRCSFSCHLHDGISVSSSDLYSGNDLLNVCTCYPSVPQTWCAHCRILSLFLSQICPSFSHWISQQLRDKHILIQVKRFFLTHCIWSVLLVLYFKYASHFIPLYSQHPICSRLSSLSCSRCEWSVSVPAALPGALLRCHCWTCYSELTVYNKQYSFPA